jgi:hypothetical protein
MLLSSLIALRSINGIGLPSLWLQEILQYFALLSFGYPDLLNIFKIGINEPKRESLMILILAGITHSV